MGFDKEQAIAILHAEYREKLDRVHNHNKKAMDKMISKLETVTVDREIFSKKLNHLQTLERDYNIVINTRDKLQSENENLLQKIDIFKQKEKGTALQEAKIEALEKALEDL